MTTFVVLGLPATKGSSRAVKSRDGRIVLKPSDKNLSAWTQAAGWAARRAQVPFAPDGTAVHVRVVYQFVRPKSQPKRQDVTVKPDVDKLARALLDALTDVAYHDDAQVVRLTIDKVYGPDARATVQVGEV